MKKVAVIVAAGSGNRMGNTPLPKQFLLVNQKPILYYTINAFKKAFEDISIIVVLPEDYMDLGREIVDAFFDIESVQFAIGGGSRFESVQNGLRLIEEEAIIFVHDAVRCFVTPELIQQAHHAALEKGTAIPVITATDSLRLVTEEGSEALERHKVKVVQTPQVFHSKILQPAFEIDFKDKFTDEASVVEAFGIKVHLIEGEVNNIKVTHPNDLIFAEKMLA